MNFKCSNAKMYIVEPDGGYTLMGSIQNLDISYADELGTVTSTLPDVSDASFEYACKASKGTIMALFGFRDSVINCCPNKRVTHLALHAKKPRTRKKNFNRAIKILEV